MTDDELQRVDALFGEALQLPAEARAAYLNEACGSDAIVRLEVDSLLKAHDDAGEFLEQGTRSGIAVADAPAPPLLAKDTRLGAFQITAPLGAGGMGTVYRARDTRLDRSVAIKILTPRRGLADDQRQRLEREARAISRLSHPHICTLFDIAQARIPEVGDIEFLVMELLDGETLAERLEGGSLSPASAVQYGIEIADALTCAHREGIVHRDLKPQNIMMTPSGTKLLDFGLASFTLRHDIPDEGTPKPVTSTGIMVGTVSYMAPEQILGHDVDARADLFSFGLVLHEMLSGRRAFDRPSTLATLHAILHDEPAPLPETVAPGLTAIVTNCLEKDPERRFQTAREIALALRSLQLRPADTLVAPVLTDPVPGGAATEPASLATPRVTTVDSRIRRRLTVAAVAVVGIALIAVRVYLSRPPLPTPRLTQLTTLPGLEGDPTFSPDGEQVAFKWSGETESQWSIYLKRVRSTEMRRLTWGPGQDSDPHWSPDGRLIAFVRSTPAGSAVYTVSPVTGLERKLTDFKDIGTAVSWLPDGRLGIFHGSRQESSASVMAPQGGELRRIMALKSVRFMDAEFSPDGRSLAYGGCTAVLGCNLQVVALDADVNPVGPPVTLVSRPVGIMTDVCWSRDGRWILYVTEPVPSAFRLWRVRADGNEGSEPVDLAGIGVRDPMMVRGSDRLVFGQVRNRVSVHPLDSTFTSPALLTSSLWDFDVQFSPDGRQLAFASTRSAESMDIWVSRADGSNARQLTQSPGRWQGSPTWSPDGRRISFDSLANDGKWHIWVVDVDGGAPRRITNDAGSQFNSAWSPDGRWVYFTPRDDQAGISRVPATGGRSERMTTAPGGFRPIISPDREHILYSADHRKPSPLLSVPLAGGSPREVLPCVRSYAASNAAVYYTECDQGPEHNVHMVDAATGRDRVIGRVRDVMGLGTPLPAVSPDGRTVLVPRGFSSTDLMLIENFR